MDMDVFKEISAPFAYLDLDLFDQNAAALVRRAHGKPIRVASKSVRCVELLKRVLAMPGYQGVLAYSAQEAIALSKQGIKDIVIGYPVVHPADLTAVALQVKAGGEITLMVDRPEHLQLAANAAVLASCKLPIAIDMDLSTHFPGLHFGVHRSHVHCLENLKDLLIALQKFPQLQLIGAMGYEAQIAGVPDYSLIVHLLKKISQPLVKQRRMKFVQMIKMAGHQLRFVNGGGTGSIEFTITDPSVTEVAAGSGLFSPASFDQFRNFKHKPAMAFVLDVTRKPAPDVVTCFAGGYIASGSTEKSKQPVPVWPVGLKLFSLEGAGEVQTPLHGPVARELQIGNRVVFRHAKAGEACERFNVLVLLKNNRVHESVKTYRGEGWNFG